jgi:hypothetical protein
MDARSGCTIRKCTVALAANQKREQVLPWRGLFRNLNEAGSGVIAGLICSAGARTMTEAQALGALVAVLLIGVYEFWLIYHL